MPSHSLDNFTVSSIGYKLRIGCKLPLSEQYDKPQASTE